VAFRLADRRYVGEVLCGSAQHRGAADVDHLDGVLLGHAFARGDLRERVEVDADEVERVNAVLVQRGQVVRVVATGEDRGVNVRMERLDAAPEQLGDLRQVVDTPDLDPVLRQVVGGAAAGDELDAELGEARRELGEALLVVRRQKCALDQEISSLTACGSSRRSTSCTRARRVSTVSPSRTGTGSAAITGPVSTPSST